MSKMDSRGILEQLRWRYATKQFDPERKISDTDWRALEDALVLTPSSFGLQPWKFVVVTNREIRESLVEHSWGQRQVADCSHLLVLAVKKNVATGDVDQLIDQTSECRGIEPESLSGYRELMISFVAEGMGEAQTVAWAKLQSYIALGNFMTVAAMMGIDTCPMEGFSAVKYDEALGLEAQGLETAVLCPAGYRASGDKYAGLAKIRYAREELVQHLE